MLVRLPRGLPFAVLVLTGAVVLSVTQGAFGTPTHATPKPLLLTMLPPQDSSEEVSRSRTVLPVRALRGVVTADLMVSVTHGFSPSKVAALRKIRGMRAVAVISTGAVTVGGQVLAGIGVDPSTFRAFTPRGTAASDGLWAAVARGEGVSSYAARLPLGTDVVANGQPLRVGALADFGLPAADIVVSEQTAASLGLQANTVLLAAPDRYLRSLKRDVRKVLGSAVSLHVLRPVAITYRRPTTYKELYMLSAQYCPGLSWKILAAIGQVESNHGRNVGPSSKGALGPMQFLPSTWASAGVDGDGDGRADILSPYDAVPAAALYLCRNGAGLGGQNLYNAIFAYNHADWYVREVLALAARY